MKILDTNKKFYSELKTLSKSNPTCFYVASFNLNVDDEILGIFKNLPKSCDKKLIVGTSNFSPKLISFLKWKLDFMNIKIYKDCHLKMVITDKGCIIGGRNITQSNWDDVSLLLINKNTYRELKTKFNNFYKKRSL